jgi:hypothetical protein
LAILLFISFPFEQTPEQEKPGQKTQDHIQEADKRPERNP